MKHHRFTKTLPRAAARLAPLSAAAALVISPHAAAQGQEAGKLQTVTVTAERRVENAQQVPNSISVLDTELLDTLNTSGQDVRMLAGRVPSLNIESSFGRAFPRFYLRGYGNTDFRLNASQPVSLVYDDVVQENPILKGFPAFDLDRIEVLRGPQGSLFGRNTPAGVVKFESARPNVRRLEGHGSLSFGEQQTVNAEGVLNLPLSTQSALRLSVLNQTRDDWVRNTHAAGPTQQFEGYRDTAARLQWLIEPSRDVSALANVHLRDYKGSARLFRANILQKGSNELVAGFDPERVSFDGLNDSEVQNTGASLRLRMRLAGGMVLHSITGYETVDTLSRGDIDGGVGAVFLPGGSRPGLIPFSSETADGMPTHRQITQELRLESAAGGPFSWQAGLYAFREAYRIESFSYDSLSPGNPRNGYLRVKQSNDAWAVFGAAKWQWSPALELRGGLRYTEDRKNFRVEDYNSAVFGTLPTLAALAATTPLSARTTDKRPNWDVSATYSLDRNTNLYARAATGFRASSVQGASAFNGQSIAGPENSRSVEAGVKADLFDRRARLNFGLFSYTVKDLQLTAVGGAANANILLNARKAAGQGFEMDAQVFVTDRMLASLGVGYNDTEIKDPSLAVSTCAACTVTDPLNAAGKALINGNPLPQAPKTTVNFTLRWGQPMGSGELYAYTDWVHRSKINFFLYESREFVGKALTEGGLRIGYTWGNGKYDAALFGRNITNQVRVVGGIDFNNLTGFINEPRTWGAQFRAQF